MTMISFDHAVAVLFLTTLLFSCAGSSPNTSKGGNEISPKLDPSQNPPGGLSPSEVPMFVSIGFDDNAFSGLPGSGGDGGMTWATNMLKERVNPDGTRARVTFYLSTTNMETPESDPPELVQQSWRTALEEGHEIGNHTHTHPHGSEFSTQKWSVEMSTCASRLVEGIGIERSGLKGFRTPFLEYNDAALEAVRNHGFLYDCSIEEGYQVDQDGTNYFWPYTLHNGSPGHETLVEFELKKPITVHPGLYEMPVYTVIVPPDDKCEAYGVPPGLRSKMKGYQDWFEEESGKITGFDYNLFVMFQMTKAEFLATLKYTLDLRLEGNRAPFLFGGHTDVYSDKYETLEKSTHKERQEAVEEFLDYAMSKSSVRVLPYSEILAWIQDPRPLS